MSFLVFFCNLCLLFLFTPNKMIYTTKAKVIEQLKDEEQFDLYQNIELPLTFILADMEYCGVKVDVNTLKAQEKELFFML